MNRVMLCDSRPAQRDSHSTRVTEAKIFGLNLGGLFYTKSVGGNLHCTFEQYCIYNKELSAKSVKVSCFSEEEVTVHGEQDNGRRKGY